ncbi:hypothetical protein [Leptospira kanakyensis]|uniref:hypothetical protein n=1 Tax=Leptospira kanakyensis TaxID=2484968 RepID=UPI00223D2158|nr:hypothetical protein [Leptospira kanakyensis]MCW7471780.1 hypothetical protein [Leptospira kanakyensis]
MNIDKNIFNQLSIEKIALYLSSNKWERVNSIESKAEIWRPLNPEDDNEIILPLSNTFKDYPERIEDLLNNLSKYFKKSIQSIINGINEIIFDQLKIQISADDIQNGTIPVNEGIDLFLNAKNMLIFSSLSTLEKKKVYSNNRPENILEFLNEVRLGQTEHGSYIINIYIPIKMKPDLPEIEDSSFARKVIKTLSNSLSALKESSIEFQNSSDLAIFDSAVEKGLSSNLCDAIVDLSGNKKERNVTIEIKISSNTFQEENISRIQFGKTDIAIAEKASIYYRQDVVFEKYKVKGYVIKLIRETSNADGQITLQGFAEGQTRNIRVQLNREQYDIAIKAHESRSILVCIGDLHIKPRSTELVHISTIYIIENEESHPEFNF